MPKFPARSLPILFAVSNLLAQPQTAPLPFDVAVIKPSAVTNGNFAFRTLPGGRLLATGVTLKMVIMYAYDVKAFRISGEPGWVNTALWDMEAKVEGTQGRTSPAQRRRMVRALLEDRFQLKVRHETREMPVFALVAGKGGSMLTPHTGAPPPPEQRIRMGRGLFSVKQGSTAPLVAELERQLWRPVVDKTGLEGEYDYTLQWKPEPGQGGAESLGLPPQPEPQPPADSDGPSIFTALREQLGLRLDSQKGPVEIIVIEGVEKPSAN
jgi:uncharacterized protein (TIGR03435 family)